MQMKVSTDNMASSDCGCKSLWGCDKRSQVRKLSANKSNGEQKIITQKTKYSNTNL